MASETDNFNRADAGDLGANWTVISGETEHGINGGAADEVNTFQNGSLRTNVTFANDQLSEADFPTLSDFISAVVVRGSTAARTYYAAGREANDFNSDQRIWKVIAGSTTSLETASTAISATDKVKLEASGTGLEMFVNDSSVFSTTDSDIASGDPGIGSLSDPNINIGRFDNWTGADLVAGGISIPVVYHHRQRNF